MRRTDALRAQVVRRIYEWPESVRFGADTEEQPEQGARASGESAAAPGERTAAPWAEALSGKRVVVCEDEGINQMQLRRALTRAGLQVVGMAANGKQGVEMTLQHRPDIVLMDIRMPVMDGLEAGRRILEQYSVCLVMLTAFSEPEFQEQARGFGASGYISKPVTSDALLPMLFQAWREFNERPTEETE